jgi:hypothetical protein
VNFLSARHTEPKKSTFAEREVEKAGAPFSVRESGANEVAVALVKEGKIDAKAADISYRCC